PGEVRVAHEDELDALEAGEDLRVRARHPARADEGDARSGSWTGRRGTARHGRTLSDAERRRLSRSGLDPRVRGRAGEDFASAGSRVPLRVAQALAAEQVRGVDALDPASTEARPCGTQERVHLRHGLVRAAGVLLGGG